jgi:hypothetical protein
VIIVRLCEALCNEGRGGSPVQKAGLVALQSLSAARRIYFAVAKETTLPPAMGAAVQNFAHARINRRCFWNRLILPRFGGHRC